MDPVSLLEQPAPAFELPDIGGSLHAVGDGRGRVMVLYFWSAECPWVARADDVLARLTPGWGESVWVWRVASNANEPREVLHRIAQARGLPVILQDESQRVAELYSVQVTPHFFVLDGEGVIRYSGALDDVAFRQKAPAHAYLEQAVGAVLIGRRPEPARTPAHGCALVRRI